MPSAIKLRNRGDTIVEVMIVLAVLGLAIGISYATANRSLLNARQAQENSQATELVRSQLEQLRSMSANTDAVADPAHYIYINQSFCIAANGRVTLLPSGACNLGEASRYAVSINWGGALSNDTFTVTATWDDVLGQGSDTVTLIYRLHVPAAAIAPLPPPPPPPPSCPAGYTGTYPDCVAPPPPPSCPAGYTGTYPDCVAPPPTCPSGTTGTYPDCGQCQWYETGTYPDCRAFSI